MTPFAQALSEHIAQARGLKLWSLIVTILGDLTPEPQDQMPGPVLQALVEALGLQPQAMRVALHRLKRDGWVDSTRAGRISHFRLSEMGRAQTDAVRARVFAGAPQPLATCALVVLPPEVKDVADEAGVLWVGRQALITLDGDAMRSEGGVVANLAPEALPDWVQELVNEAACSTGMATLAAQLAHAQVAPADPFDQCLERIVILHAWRRLALRATPLAESLAGPLSASARCRAEVAKALAQRPKLDLKRLQDAISDV